MPQPWSPTAATGQFDGIAAGNRSSGVSEEATCSAAYRSAVNTFLARSSGDVAL